MSIFPYIPVMIESMYTIPIFTNNFEDSNNKCINESLCNKDTDSFSTNSSSISSTSDINKLLINLIDLVQKNMHTAINEFDKIFALNSDDL